MTFYHFGNCVILVGIPCYLVYKAANLSEYGTFSKCIQSGILYVITQIVKMIILATFFPERKITYDSYDTVWEFFRCSADLIDLAGLYFVLSIIPGRGHVKIFTASVGWTYAQILLNNCVLFTFHARGDEFDWKYLQKAFECNLDLVNNISMATLIWMLSRNDIKRNFTRVVTSLMMVCSYRLFILEWFTHSFSITTLASLGLNVLLTLFSGLLAFCMYIQLSEMGIH